MLGMREFGRWPRLPTDHEHSRATGRRAKRPRGRRDCYRRQGAACSRSRRIGRRSSALVVPRACRWRRRLPRLARGKEARRDDVPEPDPRHLLCGREGPGRAAYASPRGRSGGEARGNTDEPVTRLRLRDELPAPWGDAARWRGSTGRVPARSPRCGRGWCRSSRRRSGHPAWRSRRRGRRVLLGRPRRPRCRRAPGELRHWA